MSAQQRRRVVKRSSRAAAKASLCSLPREILADVISLLDRPDAISLARTHPSLTALAEVSIWRELNLSVYAHCGAMHPRAPEEYMSETYGREFDPEDVDGSRRRRGLAIKERVKEIIVQADRRKWGLVETVSLCAADEAAHPTIQLLDFVSPNLKTLEFNTTRHHQRDDLLPVHYRQTLDVKLLGYELHFPSLTRIRIADRSISFIEVIPLLCIAAPNLTTLIAQMQPSLPPPSVDGPAYQFPPTVQATKIRELRITFYEWDERDWRTISKMPNAEDVNYEPTDVLIWLLKQCPKLQQLALDWDVTAIVHAHLIGVLRNFEHLVDLWWPPFISNAFSGSMPGLKRLYCMSGDLEKVFSELPALKNLELLYFHPGNRSGLQLAPNINIAPEATTYGMLPSLAEHLKLSSQLRLIKRCGYVEASEYDDINVFDELDELDFPTQKEFVRLLRHGGGGEMLHMRLRPGSSVREWRTTTGTWCDFSDYEGRAVPLDIISQMAEMEGLSEDWRGRGVEVGDAAWKVLSDWAAQCSADELGSAEEM